MWQTILNGRIFTGEIWNRRKDGTEYAEDKRISTFVKSQGTISSFVSSGRNITDRLEAERLKEETEQMLRHDLKNPVSAIVGLGEILKDCESLDRCREMGVLIENTANEVLSIAELSGTLFAMEKHSFTFEPVPVDLLETARSLTDLYYSFLKIKNITLNIVQEGDNFVVEGHRTLIDNMVGNLVCNAVEASPQNESLTVALRDQKDFVLLTVHNQGVIPEAIRDRFFERYATHGKKGGTGIGTYSARLIAEVHKGKIYFESSAATGTTLFVELLRKQI